MKRSSYGNHRSSADLSAGTRARGGWFAVLYLLRSHAYCATRAGTARARESNSDGAASRRRVAARQYQPGPCNARTASPNDGRIAVAINANNGNATARRTAVATRTRNACSAAFFRSNSRAVAHAGGAGSRKSTRPLQNVP